MKLKVLILLGVALLVRPNVYGADNKYVSELDSICASVAYRTVEYSDLVEHGINSWEQLLTREMEAEVNKYNLWCHGSNVCFYVDGRPIYVDTDEAVTDPTNVRRPARRAYDEVCRAVPLYTVKRVYFIAPAYKSLLPKCSNAAYGGYVVMIITNKTIKL